LPIVPSKANPENGLPIGQKWRRRESNPRNVPPKAGSPAVAADPNCGRPLMPITVIPNISVADLVEHTLHLDLAIEAFDIVLILRGTVRIEPPKPPASPPLKVT
jgi:hypothetical protein